MMSVNSGKIWDVAVVCFTYNHSSFVEETLNGFTTQKTSFPYVCCVVDDASTDGEQELIKDYVDRCFDPVDSPPMIKETDDYILSFAQHKINRNCYFAVLYLKYNHYGKKSALPYISEWTDKSKYIAFCEGDDYWINSSKLQKQFNVMEGNEKYSMSCHNAIRLFTKDNKVRTFNEGIPEGVLPPKTVIDRWSIPTASMFIKSELFPYPSWLAQIYSGDMALYLRCLNAGDIYYFNDIMSVYRYNTTGDSSSARMKGRETFIMEQQIILLKSFNEGTNGKFDIFITEKIKRIRQCVSYTKKREKGLVLCLFEPYLYYSLSQKFERFLAIVKRNI